MWFWAKDKSGKEGMIPANYVQKRGEVKLSTMPYVFVILNAFKIAQDYKQFVICFEIGLLVICDIHIFFCKSDSNV